MRVCSKYLDIYLDLTGCEYCMSRQERWLSVEDMGIGLLKSGAVQ